MSCVCGGDAQTTATLHWLFRPWKSPNTARTPSAPFAFGVPGLSGLLYILHIWPMTGNAHVTRRSLYVAWCFVLVAENVLASLPEGARRTPSSSSSRTTRRWTSRSWPCIRRTRGSRKRSRSSTRSEFFLKECAAEFVESHGLSSPRAQTERVTAFFHISWSWASRHPPSSTTPNATPSSRAGHLGISVSQSQGLVIGGVVTVCRA
jgi:hypothetical protein